MALKGNLRTFSIVQLLNLIHLARKSGRLRIRNPQGRMAELYFQNGKLAYAELSDGPKTLLDILYQAKRLNSKQYQALKAQAQQYTDREIGLMLVNAGYFTPIEIVNTLKAAYRDVVRTLFTWPEGDFVFDAQAPMPRGRILVRMGLENLIIEGARRLREWERLQEEIPTLEVALKFVDQPHADVQSLNLSPIEWKVLNFVSPRNTLAQIAQKLKLSDLEIRRIVYGLMQAGLVELVRPEDKPLPQIKLAFADKSKEERLGLINKIIDRIRRL